MKRYVFLLLLPGLAFGQSETLRKIKLSGTVVTNETDAVALAAVSNVVEKISGGYASDYFWWPDSRLESTEISGITLVPHGDVRYSVYGESQMSSRRLFAEVDKRPLEEVLSQPDVTWSIVHGHGATLDGDLLSPPPQESLVVVEAATSEHGTKRLSIPFFSVATGTIVANPAAELDGTWRHSIATNIAAKFLSADMGATSVYQYCRATPFGDQVPHDYPNSLQLYETDGANTDKVLPNKVNATFFWPELADKLRCITAWRGDWYAHAPYIAVAPHYAIGAKHFSKSYTQAYWCTNRITESFTYIPWSTTTPRKNGVISGIMDISVHRISEEHEFPSEMIVKMLPQTVLRQVSPSVLDGTLAIGHTSHNTVSLFYLSLRRPGRDANLDIRDWNGGYFYAVPYNRATWMGFQTFPEGTQHNTHLWDSGHPLFTWINGNLVLLTTWTYVDEGLNKFLSTQVLDRLDSIIREDSGGTEGLSFLTLEDIQ